MSISSDQIEFSVRRLPSDVRSGTTYRRWLGEWTYPLDENESEWATAIDLRCDSDRILEGWFDLNRHGYQVAVDNGKVLVVVEVAFDASDVTSSDAYVEEEGRQIVGIVQGLIYDDGNLGRGMTPDR
jgi:hypothetical protein